MRHLSAALFAVVLLVLGGPAAAQTYPQQAISGFTPTSGPAGSVITVTGQGFTGSSQAWIGSAHNATLAVVSDTTVRITVPAGTPSGQIGILNPQHAAFSPGSFTVTAAATPATPATPVPAIQKIWPTSGGTGTVISIAVANSKQITGASIGGVAAPKGSFKSWSGGGGITLTVYAGAQSGKIGLTNAAGQGLSSSSFSVTGTAAAAPMIGSMTPISGTAGTVITLSGKGFSGANAAWVGTAKNASLMVLSDSQAQVVVPQQATSGAVAVVGPAATALSPTTFTVTPPAPAPTPTPAPSGARSVRVSGNNFVDAGNTVLQLRGVNYSGFEATAIVGWNPADPSGAQAGQAYGPKWSAMQAWKINTVRIPLNEASWLGLTCTDTSGVVHQADPGSNYQASVKTQVDQAAAAGLIVILDLHWSAPGSACPMLQTQMANADHSLDFWKSVATTFKGYPGVMFELFNEPYFNFDFTGDAWSMMMKGSGGSFSGFPATSNSGAWKDVKQPWAVASFQQMIDVVRATGATNVLLIGTMMYSQDLSGWLAHRPTDPLNQLAVVWHPYPKYGAAYGTPEYAQPNFAPQVFDDVLAIKAAGLPVIATETGDRNANGTVGAPLVSNVSLFADQYGISLLGWTWDVWGETDNVLIKDVNGTPTDGYGVFFRDWLLKH